MDYSVPQLYSDNNCSNPLCDFPAAAPLSPAPGNGGGTWVCECSMHSDRGVLFDVALPELDCRQTTCPAAAPAAFPDQMSVPMMSDHGMGYIFSSDVGSQSFGPEFDGPSVSEYREEWNRVVPEFQHVFPTPSANCWGFEGNTVPAAEEADNNNINMKVVGKYSVEERKDKITRYLKKRNQRNFNKTIKYACRKTLADRRVRVRGRFARNDEICEDQDEMLVNRDVSRCDDQQIFFANDSVLNNHLEEKDWLQEAITGVAYLPYFSG